MGALGAVAVGAALRESPAILGIPLSLAAGMALGAVWGFIPGVLKAVSGAHEVVTTIMLNFVALAVLAAAVNGPLTVQGSVSPITPDVGNASLPVIFGGNGHIGIIYAPLMAVLYEDERRWSQVLAQGEPLPASCFCLRPTQQQRPPHQVVCGWQPCSTR